MSKPQRDETAPSWLNESFVENALKKGFKNNDLKILESEMKIATAVGDHYGSQMFRFNLTLRTKKDGDKEKLSVIVKCIPPGLIGEELRKMAVFEKEEEAFAKVLPAIKTLLEDAYPDHKKLWANCYYSQGPPNNAIILEDLRVRGFVLGSRREGLDLEHSVLVLKSLAKLHAASLVLKKRNPEILKIFNKTFWSPENIDSMKKMLTTPFSVIPEDMKNWDDFDGKEIYMQKLKNLKETVLEKVFEVWKVDDSKMNVLLHGDSWVNNFMFKYDPNGKLSGINFVDFQLMNVNSPALELQYFIFSSTAHSQKFEYVDLLLQTYHETFEDTLKRLGHRLENPYTLEQLKKDFEDKNFWGFTVTCTIFPLFLVPQSEVCHPEEFFSSDGTSSYDGMYKSKEMREALKAGFKYFEKKGVF